MAGLSVVQGERNQLWPGIAQPAGLAADLSAQMAFLYAESGQPMAADVVTNNHFEQDGLVAMYAFVEPESSRLHQTLLVDVAAAGDFGTYRYRDAARASMAIARFADSERKSWRCTAGTTPSPTVTSPGSSTDHVARCLALI